MLKPICAKTIALVAVMAVLLVAGCGAPSGSDPALKEVQPVVVYSARAEQLIKPIFDAYTEATGVPVKYITDSEQPLIQKLIAEGETSPADLLLTVDAGNLWFAAQAGVLQAVHSDILDANIPDHLKDPENRWFAMSVRARTIVYSTQAVDVAELSGYAGLADEKWQGRLCLRTSSKVYNQSLVAMMIAQMGEFEAEEVVRGWVANLATDVFPNDTKLIEAIEAGQCQVGIVNTYYFGRLQIKNPDIPVALFWPSADTGGVHINVSGAGVTRYAKNLTGAQALLEWMSGNDAQALLGGDNFEYPVNQSVAPHPLVVAWGEFDASPMNVAQAGKYQAAAVKLMDRAGYH